VPEDGEPGAGALSVVIAGTAFGYPEGSGAAARTRAYAKGLAESGARVHVVSLLTPGRSGPGVNPAASGVEDGVSYEYACGTRERRPTFAGRRLLELGIPLGLRRAAGRHFAATSGRRAIIVYSDQPLWIVVTALVARSLRARSVLEVCEIPLVSERDPLKLALRRWLLDRLAYRLVDGFIAISAYLEDYLRSRVPESTPIVRVPILVAPEELGMPSGIQPEGTPRQVVFVGGLEEREVGDLLAAFAPVAAGHPDVVLKVVGGGRVEVRERLATRIAALGLTDRVLLPGWATREELPRVLHEATVLVLPRRDALFSQAGFPTKLGEYLASGRPVVTTVTGEIGRHLVHAQTAYLVPPGDAVAFAVAIGHVLDHPEEARARGGPPRPAAPPRRGPGGPPRRPPQCIH